MPLVIVLNFIFLDMNIKHDCVMFRQLLIVLSCYARRSSSALLEKKIDFCFLTVTHAVSVKMQKKSGGSGKPSHEYTCSLFNHSDKHI